MRTVQMTLDSELVEAVDRAARRLGTTRSAFVRRALREALKDVQLRVLEEKQQRGYAMKPVRSGEFDLRESEQVDGLMQRGEIRWYRLSKPDKRRPRACPHARLRARIVGGSDR
jgi:predicted transcriptional regulator